MVKDIKKNKVVFAVWIVVIAACFMIFEFYFDNAAMVVMANVLLDGHFFGFYESLQECYGSGGVYPIVYPMVYAIWNIPVRFLTGRAYLDVSNIPTGIILYNKILIFGIFLGTGVVLKKIILKITDGNDLCTFKIWYWLPVSVYVAVIMGMYDLVYAFVMVCAIYFYVSDWDANKIDKLKFLVLFGVSICFKTLPAFYFLPLLLIREKKVLKLMADVMVFAVPYILCCLPFLHSEAFVKNCLMFAGSASGSLLAAYVGNTYLIPVVLILIYAYCYFLGSYKERDLKQEVFICNLVTCTIFGLGNFHPQWFIVAAPFMVLSVVYVNREELYKNYMVLGLSCISYFIVIANTIENEFLMTSGILGEKGLNLLKNNSSITMKEIYHITDLKFAYSLFLGCLLSFTIFSYKSADPGRPMQKVLAFGEGGWNCWKQVKAISLIALMAFILPASLCYSDLYPVYVYAGNTKFSNISCPFMLRENDELAKVVHIGSKMKIESVRIRSYTWNNRYGTSMLSIAVRNEEDGNGIYYMKYPLASIKDGVITEIETDGCILEPGVYAFVFRVEDSCADFAIAGNKEQTGKEVIYNGEILSDTDLQLKLLGREQK